SFAVSVLGPCASCRAWPLARFAARRAPVRSDSRWGVATHLIRDQPGECLSFVLFPCRRSVGLARSSAVGFAHNSTVRSARSSTAGIALHPARALRVHAATRIESDDAG